MRIALAQVNPTVGDLAGNTRLVLDWIEKARNAGADIVCFPELVLTGYPPEDLVLKPSFVRDNIAQLKSIAKATRGISAVVGFVEGEFEGNYGVMSLLTALAYPPNDRGLQLQSIARVGSGFNDQDRVDWLGRLSTLRLDAPRNWEGVRCLGIRSPRRS